MRAYDFVTLDVFTETPFEGNPLAVLPDATGLDPGLMQRIAAEFNLSETAFVLPGSPPSVRIYTPREELPFAGHPTIGTAHALVRAGTLDPSGPEGAALVEAAGTVRLTRDEALAPGAIFLHAPVDPARGPDLPEPGLLAGMLRLAASDLHPHWPPEAWSAGVPFACIALRDPALLARIAFDVSTWTQLLRGTRAEKVYVFAPGAAPGQIAARMFAPSLGIGEDPATGAAAVALAGYLARHAGPPEPDTRVDWEIAQGTHMGRPSRLLLQYGVTAGGAASVRLGGHAVVVSEGRLLLPAAN